MATHLHYGIHIGVVLEYLESTVHMGVAMVQGDASYPVALFWHPSSGDCHESRMKAQMYLKT